MHDLSTNLQEIQQLNTQQEMS
jgi:archaellum component FlaC